MVQKLVHEGQKGFTIIEMLVSLAIFAIVVTTSVGALLVLIAGNNILQSEQNIMTNLTFMMDSMTREIRTGTSYFCSEVPSPTSGNPTLRSIFGTNSMDTTLDENDTRDCPDGRDAGPNHVQGVSFVETGGSIASQYGGATRISYYFDPTQKTVFRKVGNNAPESIVSTGIDIERAEFFVTGAERAYGPGNLTQPTVTIVIEAIDATNELTEPFYMQTTVSQRRLDL